MLISHVVIPYFDKCTGIVDNHGFMGLISMKVPCTNKVLVRKVL